MKLWDELVGSLIGYAVAGVIAALALAAIRTTGGWGRLFLLARLRPGAWGGQAVFGHYLLFRASPYFAVALVMQVSNQILPGDSNFFRIANLAASLAYCGFLAASIHLLSSLSRTPASKVGLGLARWRPHVAIGAIAFLVGTPIILGVSVVSDLLFGSPDTPILQLKRAGTLPIEWIAFFLHAVVFAPIVEEWLFRGLLMGWLRRTNLLGHAIFLWTVVLLSAVDLENSSGRFYFAAILGSVYAVLVGVLYWPVMHRGLSVFMTTGMPSRADAPDFWRVNLFEAEGHEHRVSPWCDFGPAWPRWKYANAALAVFGSSLAFATAHPWPWCVPLLFFGLLNGALATRTQSIVPGMVMHVLFNVVAFISLVLMPGE